MGDATSDPGPPLGPPPPDLRRPSRKPWVVGFLMFVVVGLVLGATLVELPYFTLRPGAVRDTAGLISVGDAETYRPDGAIGYTTVSLRRATLIKLLGAWLDDDIDVKKESEILQGRDSEENKRVNLAMMDTSQQVATQVALERLGYDVPVHIGGQLISTVQEGFPADGVLEEGDTITAINGEALDEPEDLDRVMSGEHPGDEVSLKVKPFNQNIEEDVSLTLAASPDDANRGVMGVVVLPSDIQFDFPVEVTFDTGEVGGPSAGLAFTLGLLDVLTPGELTGGKKVAVTGTIASNGMVGPIGGAGQKAAAVREAGYDVFLVPSDDYEAALDHAGDVKVIKVDTLEEALAALGELGGNVEDLPAVSPGR